MYDTCGWGIGGDWVESDHLDQQLHCNGIPTHGTVLSEIHLVDVTALHIVLGV